MCVEPLGVRNNTQLPPIPKILYFRRSRGHAVDLKIESSLLVYYFHVEVRSHIGRHFAARKLGPWQWQKVEKTMEENIGHSKQYVYSMVYLFYNGITPLYPTVLTSSFTCDLVGGMRFEWQP